MLIKAERMAMGLMLAGFVACLSGCAMGRGGVGLAESIASLTTVAGIPGGADPAVAEVERRLLADRLLAQVKLQMLDRVMAIRIDQAVFSETLLRLMQTRVRSETGRGVELEAAAGYRADSEIAWRSAHFDRHEAVQSFRATHGAVDLRPIDLKAHLPLSAKELTESVDPQYRFAASQAWVRYRMAVDLVELNDRRVLSLEKVRDAYRQQFDWGLKSAGETISTMQALTEARVGYLQAEVQAQSSQIELLVLTGRLARVQRVAAPADEALGPDFEADVRQIQQKIQQMASYVPPVKIGAVSDLLDLYPPTSAGSPAEPESSAESPSVIRRVIAVSGQAVLRHADGRMARLNPGDWVAPTDEVVTWPDTRVEYGAVRTEGASPVPTSTSAREVTEAPGAGLAGGGGGDVTTKPVTANSNCPTSSGTTVTLPKFQWPPWPSTDEYGIDPGPRRTLGEVADYLSGALDRIDYLNHYAFTSVPGANGAPVGGFAIVTDPEQILPDGRAVPAAGRWQERLPRAGEVGLLDFIRGLVRAPEGRYRVIVFIVTDAPRSRGTASLLDDRALRNLARCGPMKLTNATTEMQALRARAVTENTEVTALVYEFAKRAEQQPARFLKPGLEAELHLEKSGFFKALASR